MAGLLAISLGLLQACASLGPTTPRTPDTQALTNALERLERDGFAGQVAVARGGETLLLAGFGPMVPGRENCQDNRQDNRHDNRHGNGRDNRCSKRIDHTAVMPLASLTKPFTASAILALAADGRIGLDDPIGQYLPGLIEAWAGVPLEALLTHSAGLPAEIVNRAWPGEARFEPIGRDTLIERVNHFAPDHAPGEGYNYSNVGYNLLAAVIEVVGEDSFEGFVAGTLLRPAGIQDIGFLLPDWHSDELVVGRDRGEPLGHYLDRPALDDGLGWHLRGAGDLLARPRGIVAWWQAIRDQRWLSQPWQERWLQPRVDKPDGTRYGYGLHFRDSPYGPVIGHTGGDFTFAVDFSYYPDHDLMIYLASASTEHQADLLRDDLHRTLLGRPR